MSTPIRAAVAFLALGLASGCGANGSEQAGALEAPGTSRTAGLDSELARAVASIRGESLAEHVSVLASDAFAGRFPGTAGEAKTVAYISSHLAKAGIEPAVGNSYLQEVPLVAVTPLDLPSRSLRVQKAGGKNLVLRFGEDILLSSPRPRASASIANSPVVFVGHGIVAPEYSWNDYAGVDVRGKTVVVLQSDPGLARGDDSFFKGRALTYYGTTQYKAEEAARRGAVALLLVHDKTQTSVDFSVFADGARRTRYRLATPPSAPQPIIQGFVRDQPAADLLALAGEDLAALTTAARADGFRPRPLSLSVSAEVKSSLEPMRSHNVVGVLRGSTRPDEYVVYTAHWDHVGKRDAGGAGEDHIFNGAVDNATGTASLLQLAYTYKSLPVPPERSVVFLATTAEEQGLLGAQYYADNPLFDLASTAAVINMDALFPFGETKGMTVVALGSSQIEEYMARAAKTVGRKLYPDPAPQMGAFFRSDHYPFAKKGVPAIFAVGGPAGEENVGETVDVQRYIEYVTRRYHQPADEYDPSTWDMAGIVQDVKIYFQTGYAIAMDSAFPNWYPDHEFRSLRDAMRPDARSASRALSSP